MRLTRHSDYALRVLMQVALGDGDLVRVSDVADSYAISRNHLSKVVHRLATRGYLHTVQGRHGGMRLARPPDGIVVGDVVRDFEEDFHLAECFNAARCDCRIQPACAFTGILEKALTAFFEVLDAATLADLIQPRHQLRALLASDHAPRSRIARA